MIDPTTQQLLSILHRGGAHAYWWTIEGRQSFWWDAGQPAPLPGGQRNVYVGVHPTTIIPETNPRGQRKPARELRAQLPIIAALNCLYTELDAKDFGGSKDQARIAADAITPPPSVLVDSGGGYHLYWLFDEPWSLITDEDRQRAKALQAAWVAHTGGDKAVKDLARVLRVPGTLNYKYQPPRPVTYVYADLDRRYTPDTLEAICGHLMEDPHLPEPAAGGRQTYTGDDRDRRYAQGALDREVAGVMRAQAGLKHDAIRDAAIRLGTLAGRGLLGDDQIIDELTRAADLHRTDVKDTYRTAVDGLAYGKLRPRDPQKLPSSQPPRGDGARPTADAPEVPENDRPRFTVAAEDVLYALPALRYLDRDLVLCASAFHLLYGASSSGKTFYAIERAMRQAGMDRRVLYIATEDVSGLRYRVAAWRKAHPEAGGQITWLQMPEGLDLQDHRQVAELLETIRPYEYDHIVLDTLREAHSGDENSSQDTARINRAIQRLVATGAAVDVVHHTGVAGERPRGSTALFGNCDVVIKVEIDEGLIRVSFDKIRNAPPRESIAFGLVQQASGLVDSDGQPVLSCVLRPPSQFTRRDAPISANQRKVLATLALSIFAIHGAKNSQLKAAVELPERTIYNALSWLKNKGYISQGTKGDPYYITTAGLAQLGSDYTTATDDSASESPTASTASPLQATAMQEGHIPTATAATAHTLRVCSGSSSGSGEMDDQQQGESHPIATTELFADDTPAGLTPAQWERARWSWGAGRLVEFGGIARDSGMPYLELKRLVEEASKQ